MTRPLLIALVLLAGCTTDSTEGPRGPIGKADALGSCEGACGGASLEGTCWCDEQCAAFGDCCADKADVCEPLARPCGGLQGLGCGEDEYCHFEVDEICGAADEGGTCVTVPEACAEIFSEVCGCDGVTYGNECFAHMAGTSVAHATACEEPQPQFCGGFGNLQCPSGFICVDDPGDGCDPADGGADCGGVCECTVCGG